MMKHFGNKGRYYLLALLMTVFAVAVVSELGGSDSAFAASSSNVVPTGAQLYTTHCARCHIERYPTERTDAQWETIMFHMKTRAQIPQADAELILEYLKQSN